MRCRWKSWPSHSACLELQRRSTVFPLGLLVRPIIGAVLPVFRHFLPLLSRQIKKVINKYKWTTMKALMVNSTTSTKIVEHKMRDEMYMRHLRQVEKINNREAHKIANDVKTYRSINDLHHKHKAYAFYWQNKEEEVLIEQMNDRMRKKMKEIKSYLDHRTSKAITQDCSRTSRVDNKSPQPTQEQEQEGKEAVEAEKPSPPQTKKQKQHYSLHYRYRKRRQEEIDHENQKLQKGILSQRSSYLPQIIKNRQSLSVMGKKKVEKQDVSEQKELK